MLAEHHHNLRPVQRTGARRRSLAKCVCSREDFASLKLVLKEWLPVLLPGLQVVLRKGGVREPAFQVRGRQFLLLGTAFHTVQDLLQPDAADEFVQVCQWGLPEGSLGRFALDLIGCKPAAELLNRSRSPL